MSSTWIARVGEGLVIGITASVALWIFSSMNDARLELTEARETLQLQLDVNQDLLDQTDELEVQIENFETRLAELEYSGRSSQRSESATETERPTVGSPPTLQWSNPPPRTVGATQQRIDQQKEIIQ